MGGGGTLWKQQIREKKNTKRQGASLEVECPVKVKMTQSTGQNTLTLWHPVPHTHTHAHSSPTHTHTHAQVMEDGGVSARQRVNHT